MPASHSWFSFMFTEFTSIEVTGRDSLEWTLPWSEQLATLASSKGDVRVQQMAVALVLLACSLPILQLIVDQAGGVWCANKLRCSQYAYCGTGCQSQSSYAAPKGVLPGRILFNYLGSNRVDIVYNDIPVTRNDFVWVLGLSFAIDMNLSGVPQNGTHSVSWNPNLTKAAAKSWRATHSNGRIVISIGGPQLYINNAVLRCELVWSPKSHSVACKRLLFHHHHRPRLQRWWHWYRHWAVSQWRLHSSLS